jgi:hypothetical protein
MMNGSSQAGDATVCTAVMMTACTAVMMTARRRRQGTQKPRFVSRGVFYFLFPYYVKDSRLRSLYGQLYFLVGHRVRWFRGLTTLGMGRNVEKRVETSWEPGDIFRPLPTSELD